jgi:hypothetical protein
VAADADVVERVAVEVTTVELDVLDDTTTLVAMLVVLRVVTPAWIVVELVKTAVSGLAVAASVVVIALVVIVVKRFVVVARFLVVVVRFLVVVVRLFVVVFRLVVVFFGFDVILQVRS